MIKNEIILKIVEDNFFFYRFIFYSDGRVVGTKRENGRGVFSSSASLSKWPLRQDMGRPKTGARVSNQVSHGDRQVPIFCAILAVFPGTSASSWIRGGVQNSAQKWDAGIEEGSSTWCAKMPSPIEGNLFSNTTNT